MNEEEKDGALNVEMKLLEIANNTRKTVEKLDVLRSLLVKTNEEMCSMNRRIRDGLFVVIGCFIAFAWKFLWQ